MQTLWSYTPSLSWSLFLYCRLRFVSGTVHTLFFIPSDAKHHQIKSFQDLVTVTGDRSKVPLLLILFENCKVQSKPLPQIKLKYSEISIHYLWRDCREQVINAGRALSMSETPQNKKIKIGYFAIRSHHDSSTQCDLELPPSIDSILSCP